MSDEAWFEDVKKSTRTLQLIVVAIGIGVTTFLGIALFIALSRNGSPEGNPPGQAQPVFLALVSAAVVAFGLFVRTIAMWVVTQRTRGQLAADRSSSSLSDKKSLLKLYLARTIIGAASVEGVALFAIIAYIVERSPISLGIAVFLLLVIAAHFPTSSRIISWVEREVETLEMARGLSER